VSVINEEVDNEAIKSMLREIVYGLESWLQKEKVNLTLSLQGKEIIGRS